MNWFEVHSGNTSIKSKNWCCKLDTHCLDAAEKEKGLHVLSECKTGVNQEDDKFMKRIKAVFWYIGEVYTERNAVWGFIWSLHF